MPTVGLLISLSGAAVLYGHAHGYVFLTNIKPEWVSMKPLTAFLFIITGLMIASLQGCMTHRHKWMEICCSTAASGLIAIMFWESLGYALDGTMFLAHHDISLNESVGNGVPSIGTMIAFMLTGLGGYCAVFNTYKAKIRITLIGGVILTIAALSITSYVFDLPVLRFKIPNISTAMAAYTAWLFTLVGACFITAGRR